MAISFDPFIAQCEHLVESMYSDGCPCQYERFRNFIEWNKPVCFLDQENLYRVFSKKLERVGEKDLTCPICGTCFHEEWEQYTAFLWVLNVTISKMGNIGKKGASPLSPVPVAFGFQGYQVEDLIGKYVQTDVEEVMAYLKEKGI
jgi:hypothetical protein